MAEARNAADLYYLQRGGGKFGGSKEGYYSLNFSVPTPSTLARKLALFTHRVKYSLINRIWPATPTMLVAVMGGVTAFTVSAKGDSWVRSGWLADALWRVDSRVFAPLNPFHGYYSTQFRVGYLASAAAFVGMLGIVTVERFFLRILLSWQGWLYAVPGKPTSMLTYVWGGLVKLLSGKKNLTYSFGLSLPSLPLPPLKQTCDAYLKSVKPLLSSEDYERTKANSQKFQQNEGKTCQRWLWLKHLFYSNYVTDWWEKYCYLYGRTPIMINSNYYVLDSKFRPTLSQTARAGRLVHHMLVFKDLIEEETLEPMRIRGLIPLCMEQYQRMFGTCRLPGREFDTLQTVRSRYIIVCSKGHYYKLNVYHGVSGTHLTPYSAEEIISQLEVILEHSSRALPPSVRNSNSFSRRGSVQSFEDLVVLDSLKAKRGGLSGSVSSTNFAQLATQAQMDKPVMHARKGANIAAFTAGPRTRWAEVRELYFCDGVNRLSLEAIEKSAFIVFLEDAHHSSLNDRAKSLFHGNGANRWFDKSINLVVYDDAYAGMNCEHSWADAPAIAHLWEYAMLSELWDYETMAKKRIGSGEESSGDIVKPLSSDKKANTSKLMAPKRLIWDINDELQAAIEQATSFANQLIEDLDLEIVEHLDYGAGFIKKVALCSPDGYVQMALQLAYHRSRGQFDLTYESSMTRLFHQGRTETTRSLSQETCDFVLAMEQGKPAEDIIAILRDGCDKHALKNKDCMAGKGCDRHLFALYIVTKALDVSSEFLIEALTMPWRLSTSQQPQDQTTLRKGLPKETVDKFVSPGGGFGPVADDGYGVSYMFAGNDQFFFHISSKNSADDTSSKLFATALCQALKDMKHLFE